MNENANETYIFIIMPNDSLKTMYSLNYQHYFKAKRIFLDYRNHTDYCIPGGDTWEISMYIYVDCLTCTL